VAIALFNQVVGDRCPSESRSDNDDVSIIRERLCTAVLVDRFGAASPERCHRVCRWERSRWWLLGSHNLEKSLLRLRSCMEQGELLHSYCPCLPRICEPYARSEICVSTRIYRPGDLLGLTITADLSTLLVKQPLVSLLYRIGMYLVIRA
jgi:hypothetical protein